MSIVDVDVLLQELSADAPCGPNLEYDPAFLELEQSALDKPEVQYGDTIVPAASPEWKQVKRQALELLARTRDLRVAMPLVRALLALHAMPGFADGLRLLDRMAAEHWDRLHPELDPDDDHDPTLRLNTLSMLTDAGTLLRELRDTVFLQLPGLGPLSLRVLDQASGDLPAPDGQGVTSLASIEAALRDVAPETLGAAHAAAATALDSALNLESTLMRQVGATQALDFAPLTRQLRRVRDLLASGMPAAPAAGVGTEAAPQPGAASAPGSGAPAAISGEINSRTDVLRMLDKILAYYARYEPSSPVPMLIERAKRLAPKSFFEVMEDLAPDGVSQLRVIRGPVPEEQSE